MRKTILSILLSVAALSANAQSMKELWVNINDDITPYLTQKMRKEMVEMKELGVSGDVKNSLNGTSLLDTITGDYLKVELSKAKTIEMKRLPLEGSDSIVCMVTTLYAPEAQSTIEFYDTKWNKLPTEDYFTGPYSIKDMMQKPDSISEERFTELSKLIELDLIEIKLTINSNELEISPSFPLLSKEDKKELEAIVPERKLKWMGKTFN